MSPMAIANRRQRLDLVMVSRGIAPTREEAKALILAGAICVNGQKVEKVGTRIPESADITIIESALPFHGHRYVGRGGMKLEGALDRFELNPDGCVVLDVGASTGGFTDCLLQRGTKRVYAVDVGYGQLAWKLRTDPRVVVLERKHIRDITRLDVPEAVDWVTIDVSFISLKKVLPFVLPFVRHGGVILALVKPQFEVGRGEVGKGGIVRNADQRERSVQEVSSFAEGIGLASIGVFESPVHGQDGNLEYFILMRIRKGDLADL